MKATPQKTGWTVGIASKARKQRDKLPEEIADALLALWTELCLEGPIQPEWSHYGKLKGRKNEYHCHLNKGKPTYVAVWMVTDKQIKLLEICYVGTHENAPY
jgi:mRNA-degrading endonuclease RelE of RelBE toxin-antitoxin system